MKAEAREQAFYVLFAFCSTDQTLEHALSDVLGKDESRRIKGQIEKRIEIWKNRSEEIDSMIERNLDKNKKLKDLSNVALSVLRLGLVELFYMEDIPPKVAINEAVELAGRFADPANRSLVNAVLDACLKKKGREEPAETSTAGEEEAGSGE